MPVVIYSVSLLLLHRKLKAVYSRYEDVAKDRNKRYHLVSYHVNGVKGKEMKGVNNLDVVHAFKPAS